MENISYRLYNSCKLIKGHNAYLIYDLGRIKAYYVSLKIGNYIINQPSVNLLKKDKQELDGLIKKEILYEVNSVISENMILNINPYESSSLITNLILDFSDYYLINAYIIIDLIENIRIKNIQIQIDSGFNINSLLSFIDYFSNTIVNHIELVFRFQCDENDLFEILSMNDRVQSIMVIKKQDKSLINNGKILFISDKIYLQGAHPIKFSINKMLFDESQEFNTYFNKKLHIDKFGNLNNAPEYKKIFINIFKNYSINKVKKIINTKEFRKYWQVKKSSCNICKDCEFRHMCVDNRLPFQDNNGLWSHQIECNYNPYTNKWKNEK